MFLWQSSIYFFLSFLCFSKRFNSPTVSLSALTLEHAFLTVSLNSNIFWCLFQRADNSQNHLVLGITFCLTILPSIYFLLLESHCKHQEEIKSHLQYSFRKSPYYVIKFLTSKFCFPPQCSENFVKCSDIT